MARHGVVSVAKGRGAGANVHAWCRCAHAATQTIRSHRSSPRLSCRAGCTRCPLLPSRCPRELETPPLSKHGESSRPAKPLRLTCHRVRLATAAIARKSSPCLGTTHPSLLAARLKGALGCRSRLGPAPAPTRRRCPSRCRSRCPSHPVRPGCPLGPARIAWKGHGRRRGWRAGPRPLGCPRASRMRT